MSAAPPAPAADARLILRPEELDAALEQFLLAEAALWEAAERALAAEGAGLGRSHFRAAFLLKRRPGIGVKELARLTGLSKQAASRSLSDLVRAGYAEAARGEEDGRRRPTVLTAAGARFEAQVAEALRGFLLGGFREAGLDAVLGARRVLVALAGPRGPRRLGDQR
jgi:DNA-binding MarR family transcriptional regulator